MDQSHPDTRVSLADMRLLPRFREHAELRTEQARVLRSEASRAAAAGLDVPAMRAHTKAEPGDLRGIPVIGVGVGGVSPGTSPESSIGRLDRERDRRQRANAGPAEPMVAYG